jgi:hypothetical protein
VEAGVSFPERGGCVCGANANQQQIQAAVRVRVLVLEAGVAEGQNLTRNQTTGGAVDLAQFARVPPDGYSVGPEYFDAAGGQHIRHPGYTGSGQRA